MRPKKFALALPDIGAFEYGSATFAVYAVGQIASLDGDVGLFVLGGMPSRPHAVHANLVVSGTASNGVDYVSITNTVIIPTVITNDANYLDPRARDCWAFAATNKKRDGNAGFRTNYQISASDSLNPNTATVALSDHSTIDASTRYHRGTPPQPTFIRWLCR